ncbi:hypothetical protein [Deinococcus sp. NW-56]|uniref:hypothetical protein n=1 Tax=Deinococcus sp. NW-56 TaxID=2080419 RepID=UPI00131A03B0|nr:hypothetical protein [Deinococcus sp. NW-56]
MIDATNDEQHTALNGRVAHVVSLIRPGGGPSGYLYNLASISERHPERNFDILAVTRSDQRSKWQPSERFGTIIRLLRPLSPSLRSVALMSIQFWIAKRSKPAHANLGFMKSLQAYSCLVFHERGLAESYMQMSSVPGQKVFVMPHAPTDLSLESLEDYENYLGARINKRLLLHRMREEEIDFYEGADGIVAPSRYSLDSYFIGDDEIRSRFDHMLINRLHTVITGVPGKESTRSEEYRSKVNPHGKRYVVGYFGRYNEQKGFDLYLEVVGRMQNRSDIQFVCAGGGGLQSHSGDADNLIDLGWIFGEYT